MSEILYILTDIRSRRSKGENTHDTIKSREPPEGPSYYVEKQRFVCHTPVCNFNSKSGELNSLLYMQGLIDTPARHPTNTTVSTPTTTKQPPSPNPPNIIPTTIRIRALCSAANRQTPIPQIFGILISNNSTPAAQNRKDWLSVELNKEANRQGEQKGRAAGWLAAYHYSH